MANRLIVLRYFLVVLFLTLFLMGHGGRSGEQKLFLDQPFTISAITSFQYQFWPVQPSPDDSLFWFEGGVHLQANPGDSAEFGYIFHVQNGASKKIAAGYSFRSHKIFFAEIINDSKDTPQLHFLADKRVWIISRDQKFFLKLIFHRSRSRLTLEVNGVPLSVTHPDFSFQVVELGVFGRAGTVEFETIHFQRK